MTRGLPRRWFLLSIVLVLLVVAWLLSRSIFAPRITPENYERVQLGMLRDEVEAILGPPPESHPLTAPRLRWNAEVIATKQTAAVGRPRGLWGGDLWDGGEQHGILVTFDEEGKAVAKQLWNLDRDDPTWIERIRAWLGI